MLGKHKTALEAFDEAEQLNSEDREIWHNKGDILTILTNRMSSHLPHLYTC